jgi:hypothetical protein
MSFVAEGSANYGVDLAFPGNEGPVFERDVLLPLAGLPPADIVAEGELGAAARAGWRAPNTPSPTTICQAGSGARRASPVCRNIC